MISKLEYVLYQLTFMLAEDFDIKKIQKVLIMLKNNDIDGAIDKLNDIKALHFYPNVSDYTERLLQID